MTLNAVIEKSGKSIPKSPGFNHSPKRSDFFPWAHVQPFNLKPVIYPWITLRESLNRKPWFIPSKVGVPVNFAPPNSRNLG